MPETFYVSLTGQDSNPGTEAEPFRHVQSGVDALQAPGDGLKIRGGTYVESVIVDGKTGGDGEGTAIYIESYEG
jgi:hypothetical protein